MKVDAVGLMTDGTKWYPIVFKNVPQLGDIKLRKLKSMGHHTQGFENKDDAIEGISLDPLLKEVPRLKGDLFWGKDTAKVILISDDYTVVNPCT